MAKKVLLCLFTYFIFLFGVKAYTSYNQGDVVSYNGMDFYVLYDSDSSSNVLTLLKKEPLTVSEVNVILWHELTNYRICFVLKGFLLKQA